MNNPVTHQDQLKELFRRTLNDEVSKIEFLGTTASDRSYYRIFGKSHKAIGVYHINQAENLAFTSFTESFRTMDLNVPLVIAKELSKNIYLIEDLGDLCLFDLLENKEIAKSYYKKALFELIKLQTKALPNLDLNLCTPRAALDEQSLQWDLNYFKYYFLKLKNISFDEQKLEDDFHRFISDLLKADQSYFIHRDFQSRNIMIHDGKAYLIDYQGGRKGPLQYDVVSLLFQVKAQLSEDIKDELLQYYLDELTTQSGVKKETFMMHYFPYALMRLLQVMGAYGFRGLYEKKIHFIESIPFALNSLKNLLDKYPIEHLYPELHKSLSLLLEEPKEIPTGKLHIKINSFAYKHGIPKDDSGHGEGFVFDCRFLPNPGRLSEYKSLSGKDLEVINYLKAHSEVNQAKDLFITLAEKSINNYIERGFEHLCFNFGCTGGQHRSVYFAEGLMDHLSKNYNLKVTLTHTQEQHWKK